MEIQSQIGEQIFGAGERTHAMRSGRFGDVIVSELRGRFAEAALSGRLFTGGMTLTSISNATFSFTSTTDATATPIIGLWNPVNSGVNCVLLQAHINVVMTALQATGPGAYVWTYSINNLVLPTTGTLGFNCRTLSQSGGVAKCLAGAAMTGKTNANALLRGSSISGGSAVTAAFLATQVALQTQAIGGTENIDGSIIVPPGGVVGLFCTATPVGHSAASGLLWTEEPV